MPSYVDAIEKVLKHEGGYVFDKNDRGGRTNMGITQTVYEQFLGRKLSEAEAEQVMKNMPKGNAIQIYKSQYWDKIKGDQIKTYIVAFLIFDAAVNSGVTQAIKTAQRVLGINPDGVAGPEYLKHLNNFDPQKFVDEYIKARKSFYQTIVDKNPTQQKFLKGWLKRASLNEAYAKVVKFVGTTAGKATVGIGGLLLLTGVFFLLRSLRKK
jgi:lysozyme family protein